MEAINILKKIIIYLSLSLNVLLILGLLLILILKGPSWYVHQIESVVGSDTSNQMVTNESHYNTRLDVFKTMKIPNDEKIIFLGDSITQDANVNELFNVDTVLNRGIGGDTTWGVLNRLESITDLSPEKLFIMIGINDFVLGRTSEDILDKYEQILTEISKEIPTTEVYVLSILPLNNEINGSLTTPETIIDFNKELKKTSEAHKFKYIDLHSSFVDADNYLDKKYSLDGAHLTGEGYKLWREKLIEYIN